MTGTDIWIPGTPRAKGSYTPIRIQGGGVFLKSPQKTVAWEQLVSAHAGAQYDGPVITEATEIEMTFYFTRPKVHFRTGRYSELLKDSAPKRHISKPDLDKLARAVLDGLTGSVLRDDCIVDRVVAWKTWAKDGPGARLRIVQAREG